MNLKIIIIFLFHFEFKNKFKYSGNILKINNYFFNLFYKTILLYIIIYFYNRYLLK